MHDPAPHGPSIAFLVFAWTVFLLLGAVSLALLPGEGWRGVRVVLFVFFVWAVITGILFRRLFPRSRIGILFPDRTADGARFDSPASHGLLTILCVLAFAAALVAASLHFGWRWQ